mmetsp:Transcript_103982/g.203949  ORF Transcript_103982/g.203949 Transcript_103982/m.203949 type:complete len:205 (-) Transcript_103982:7-621(-)
MRPPRSQARCRPGTGPYMSQKRPPFPAQTPSRRPGLRSRTDPGPCLGRARTSTSSRLPCTAPLSLSKTSRMRWRRFLRTTTTTHSRTFSIAMAPTSSSRRMWARGSISSWTCPCRTRRWWPRPSSRSASRGPWMPASASNKGGSSGSSTMSGAPGPSAGAAARGSRATRVPPSFSRMLISSIRRGAESRSCCPATSRGSASTST